MKDKKILSALAILSIAFLSVSLVSAFGFGSMKEQNNGNGLMIGQEDLSEEQIAKMQEFRDSIQNAIENNNFDEWKILMESQLTQERFNQLVEQHSKMSERIAIEEQMQQAWETEDYETLRELREQMIEIMPEKSQTKENCNGNCKENLMNGEKQNFFHQFRFR